MNTLFDDERIEFIEELGLSHEHFWNCYGDNLPSTEIMKEAYEFLACELGLENEDINRIPEYMGMSIDNIKDRISEIRSKLDLSEE